MVTGGVDIVTVKEILGHSSIEMTTRYVHPTPENKRKAVDVLASVFDGEGQEMETARSQRDIREEDFAPSISTNQR